MICRRTANSSKNHKNQKLIRIKKTAYQNQQESISDKANAK